MDDASSKFVDQLVLEKLVEEKLGTVHHRPLVPPSSLLENAAGAYAAPLPQPNVIRSLHNENLIFQTPVSTTYPENETIPVQFYPAPRTIKGSVLLVHGLFEDNRDIYNFVIGELNRQGYAVYMTTLPFHHDRTPRESHYSGELFLSGDLGRTKQAFIQAVLEVRLCHDWIRATRGDAPIVVGFSMGGTVVLAAAAASNNMTRVCAVNPAAKLSEVIWTSPLCATIKADLLDAGWLREDIYSVLASFDPYMVYHRPRVVSDTLMIYGLYDQITREDQYQALASKWGMPNVLTYKAGHLNTLRVPRFALDIVQFDRQRDAAKTHPEEGSRS